MKLDRFGFRKDFDINNRFNLKTRIERYVISTVDLGVNHQFIEGLPPLWYETMIFDVENIGEENSLSWYQERYTTEEEARKGHQEAIEFVKKFLMEVLG